MSRFIEFSQIPEKQLFPGITGRIVHSDQVTLMRVSLEEGAVLPEHHHVNEQWTTVIEGELEMEMNGEKKIARPGMSVFISSNTPHAARALTRCIVVDMFTPKRADL